MVFVENGEGLYKANSDTLLSSDLIISVINPTNIYDEELRNDSEGAIVDEESSDVETLIERGIKAILVIFVIIAIVILCIQFVNNKKYRE